MANSLPARRLLLVRHGHYKRIDDLGDTVWGISAKGRRQAARTGRRLHRLVPNFGGKFEGIYSSPWPRALQTAEIIAHELDQPRVRIKPYLHEIAALVPTDDDGKSIHPGLPPSSDGERQLAVEQLDRIFARFFKASKTDTTYVIVCHGNLIRYLVARVMGLPLESWMRMDIAHASVSEIRVFPGDIATLQAYNDTGHMPPELVST